MVLPADFLAELRFRGMFHQCTNEQGLAAHLHAIKAAGRQTSEAARLRTLARRAGLVATLARDSVTYPEDVDPVRTTASAIIAELDAARLLPE